MSLSSSTTDNRENPANVPLSNVSFFQQSNNPSIHVTKHEHITCTVAETFTKALYNNLLVLLRMTAVLIKNSKDTVCISNLNNCNNTSQGILEEPPSLYLIFRHLDQENNPVLLSFTKPPHSQSRFFSFTQGDKSDFQTCKWKQDSFSKNVIINITHVVFPCYK